MTEWEAVVGLEIHVHLKTRTKMFCRCETGFGAEPNTRTCPVCLAHPGQGHPADPIGKHLPEMGRDFQRQACFATASRPNQCHQAHLFAVEKLGQALHLPVPPNQACQRSRQDAGEEGDGGRRWSAVRGRDSRNVQVKFA